MLANLDVYFFMCSSFVYLLLVIVELFFLSCFFNDFFNDWEFFISNLHLPFLCYQIVHSIEDLKQSVEERVTAVKKSEEGAADLNKRAEELSKSLENFEKEYQVSIHACLFASFYSIETDS